MYALAELFKSAIIEGQLFVDGWSFGLGRGEGNLHVRCVNPLTLVYMYSKLTSIYL
jgi:hypothetical protein